MRRIIITEKDYNSFNDSSSYENNLLSGVDLILHRLSGELREEVSTKGIELHEEDREGKTVINFLVPDASQKLKIKLESLKAVLQFIKL